MRPRGDRSVQGNVRIRLERCPRQAINECQGVIIPHRHVDELDDHMITSCREGCEELIHHILKFVDAY